MNLNQKYRPNCFEDVCGQTITTTILKKVIENRAFKNCYLFAGKTGSGKTTCARIFANMINQNIGAPIELDCASNGSVDSIRSIMESANQRSLTGEYKIFILDECHAISNTGWQAFLKGIEETPTYTIFIFCTTEPQKVPATILNRVQRYNFAPIAPEAVKDRLMQICQLEHFINYEQACDLISKNCFGSMRDAITTLEQVSDYSVDLSINNISKVLDLNNYESMFKLTWALQKHDEKEIFNIIDLLYASGHDLKNYISSYLTFVINLLKYTLFKDISLTNIPAYLATEQNSVVQFTVQNSDSKQYFNQLAENLFELKEILKNDIDAKSTIEVFLLKIVRNK